MHTLIPVQFIIPKLFMETICPKWDCNPKIGLLEVKVVNLKTLGFRGKRRGKMKINYSIYGLYFKDL